MYTDRMRINHDDDATLPNYGSLYLVRYDEKSRVNDYGGAVADVEKLDLITNAAPGSTCLFSNGDIYRLELDGWAKFGEDTESEAEENSASTTSLNLSPMDIDRAALTSNVFFANTEDDAVDFDYEPDLPEEAAVNEGEESTLETQKSSVTSSTADEVSV